MKTKRFVLWAATALLLVGASVWSYGQLASQIQPLSSLMPPGALLYLEAKDFGKLLGEWNGSTEKQKWLASDNYGVLSRSRLLLRLQQARDEFQEAAEVSPEMQLLQQVAGKESAFAFYNLGDLKFLYVTRGAKLDANDLWNARSKYEPRKAGDIPFYVRRGKYRTVAFASKDDLLFIASDERILADALALTAKQQTSALSGEAWFQQAITASKQQGDLRLVYDLQKLVATPQFRTYWIQQNTSYLKQYTSGISDLFEKADSFEENRTLFRQSANATTPDEQSLADVARLVPQQSSLYRGWASPSAEQLATSLRQVALGEASTYTGEERYAPVVSEGAGAAGSASDLETRIDQPEFRRKNIASLETAEAALAAMKPKALLHVQATAILDDKVFVTPESAIAVLAGNPDISSFKAALEKALGTYYGFRDYGNLSAVTSTVQGSVLLVSNSPRLEQAILQNANATAGQPASYVAGYNHMVEWPNYQRLFSLLDKPQTLARPEGAGAPPLFFSGNVRSLGDTLARLEQATIQSHDAGTTVTETVRYKLRAK